MSKMTAENSRERRNRGATTGRIPRKNVPNVQLATKRTTRRNGVGKALEPTSSPKTSNWIIPKPRKLPWVKMTLTINLLLPLLKTQKLDLQQQVKHTPTNFQNLDLLSDGQHFNTTTTRPVPFIDNYNPYYPDPDFGFDPYLDIQIYDQHHLLFYNNFAKNITDIEPDSPKIDQNFNTKFLHGGC